jgi:hypothetical protein
MSRKGVCAWALAGIKKRNTSAQKIARDVPKRVIAGRAPNFNPALDCQIPGCKVLTIALLASKFAKGGVSQR